MTSTSMFSVVLTLLALAFASHAAAREPIAVQLVDGRQLTAEVDGRTDHQYVWLVLRTRSAELLRPIAWQRVDTGEWQGESLKRDDFRAAVLAPPKSIAPAGNRLDQPKVDEPASFPQSPGEAQRTMAEEALDVLFSPASAR